MPKKYPKVFCEDVVRVALSRDRDVSLAQIARDFEIHVGTLDRRLCQERIDNGEHEGGVVKNPKSCASYGVAIAYLNRKTRFYGVQRRICRRRIYREKVFPAHKTAGVARNPCDVDVSGVKAV